MHAEFSYLHARDITWKFGNQREKKGNKLNARSEWPSEKELKKKRLKFLCNKTLFNTITFN